MKKVAEPWRVEEGRWVRMSGPIVVCQVTDTIWYLLRAGGSGGLSGTARTVEIGRRSVDRHLLKDGWELSF